MSMAVDMVPDASGSAVVEQEEIDVHSILILDANTFEVQHAHELGMCLDLRCTVIVTLYIHWCRAK